MKIYIIAASLFLCTFTKTMEQQTDPLGLIVSKSGYGSEISHVSKHEPPITTNSIKTINTPIKNKNLHCCIYDIKVIKPDKSSLILVIKDNRPSRNNMRLVTSPAQNKTAITNVSDHTHINVPSEEILYAVLERFRYGYMAMHTQLPSIIGGQELTRAALAAYITTALRESNNLYSAEELEYHTHKIVKLIIDISSFNLKKAKL